MSPQLCFGISVLLGFLVWGLVTARYIWPALRTRRGAERFRPILFLHAFRFIGLAFIVPGVVSPDLPAGFALPAAYGDLGACLLALVALGLLEHPGGLLAVWLFNLWGTGDLLYAYYEGAIGVGLEAGQMGAAYFIPTALVPLLLITHFLVFRMLIVTDSREAPLDGAA